MTTPEVRPIRSDEARSWLRAEQRSFGIEPSDERLDELIGVVDRDRCFAAVDDGEIVATGGAHTTRMHLPGGESTPVAAVTAIGTRPTHTRRSLMRSIMDLLHTQSGELGETAAVLLASESLLYPRFGYGRATTARWIRLDRRRAQLRDDIPVSDRVEMFVDVATAHALIDGIWRRVGPQRPGWLDRPRPLLDHLLADRTTDRHGAMPFTLVVHHDTEGTPDGYCLYRRNLAWEHGHSIGSLFVHELAAVGDTAHRSLWHHCLSIDLVETIEAMPVPDDDPLVEALVDPRQLRTTAVVDQLWLRPGDASALLGTRRYDTSDRVVIEVAGMGRFAVDGGPDGADVEPTDESADLTMGRAELGAVIVGRSLRPLTAAGRIDVADPAQLDRWDRFMRWPVAPYNLLDF